MRIGREARHAANDVVEAQHVRVEHGTAAVQRKPIAGEVNDVDIGRALRNALETLIILQELAERDLGEQKKTVQHLAGYARHNQRESSA